MAGRRPAGTERPVVLAIDHLFVEDESDGLAQGVYDALAALDVAWPAAICPIATEDLGMLVASALRRCNDPATGSEGRDGLGAAARRVGHALERAPDVWPSADAQVRRQSQ